jgi:isochorismate synthase
MHDPQAFTAQIHLPLTEFNRKKVNTDSHGTHWWLKTGQYGEKPKLEISRHDYDAMLNHAITTMRQGPLEKVVLSRMQTVELPSPLDPNVLLDRLLLAYPEACVFQINCLENETWMGATPEKLLVKRGKNYQTIALAGTRIQAEMEPWTNKEIHEEEVVKEYIISILNLNGATNVRCSELYERQAGPLVHLAHDIKFESEQEAPFWSDLLHPTPAVCGLPLAEASAYIADHEPHDRGLYTGILGCSDSDGNADVYVLLRCLRLIGKNVEIYSGGGITAASNAADEWQETESKAAVIKSLLPRSF